MKLTIALLLIILSGTIITLRIVKSVQLKQNCTGFLKWSADANTVETAKNELQKSIKYLEDNNLTKGHTSVFFNTPDEDIEFWYKNLKASESELSKVNDKTSGIEKTNLLMKLRETLLDNNTLTIPEGLSVYPNNGLWALLIILALILILGLIILILID